MHTQYPKNTEVEGSQIVVGENVLQEPCSNKQPNARLVGRYNGIEKPGSDSLKIPRQIKLIEKKRNILLNGSGLGKVV